MIFKYQGPVWVENLYHDGSYDILNRIARVSENQSLDFYLGMADDLIFGPVSSAAAGCALLMFCLAFLKDARGWVFALTIFFYLALTRLEVFFYPPYGDAVGGIFTDVIWIARHSFNFFEFFNQETFGTGGWMQYPVCVYPSFLAFLMMITPTAASFLFTIHALTFLASAVVVSVFRRLLMEVFDRESSLLIALLLVALPLFQGMAEAINMEMPCLFFAILAVYFLLKERLFLSFLTASLSLLIKLPGAISSATVFTGCVLLLIMDPCRENRKKILFWGLVTVVFAVMILALRTYLVGPQSNTTNVTKFLIGLKNFRDLGILKVFGVTSVVFLLRCLIWVRDTEKEKRNLQQFLREHYIIILMFVMTALWFLLYMNFLVMIHRYKLLVAPFLMFFTAAVFLPLIKRPFIVKNALIAAIVFLFFCSHGLLYRNPATASQNEFEGSLEYRNDLKLKMKIAREIDEKYSRFLIVSPYIIAQVLDFHEVGYVTQPLSVMVYGHRTINEGVREFHGLSELNLARTVWIGLHKEYDGDFPVGKDDKILKIVEAGNKKAYIFMGGFAIERKRIMIMRYLMLLELQKKGLLPQEISQHIKAL